MTSAGGERLRPSTPTVSVVVPVYGNEGSLPPLFDALLAVEQGLAQRGLGLELIFVDDGSPDGSLAPCFARAQAAAARHQGGQAVAELRRRARQQDRPPLRHRRVLHHPRRRPPGPPELILEMADLWLQGSKFVVCVREGREDSLRRVSSPGSTTGWCG